jgi:hypothetical protein
MRDDDIMVVTKFQRIDDSFIHSFPSAITIMFHVVVKLLVGAVK